VAKVPRQVHSREGALSDFALDLVAAGEGKSNGTDWICHRSSTGLAVQPVQTGTATRIMWAREERGNLTSELMSTRKQMLEIASFRC